MEIVRREASSAALGTLASAGRGADVSALSFDARELTLDDLPADFPTGNALVLAGEAPSQTTSSARTREPLAFIVRQLPKPVRIADGSVVQRRIGYGVHHDRLELIVSERALTALSPGKLKPSGDWQMVTRTAWSATPTKSSGTAAPDVPSTSESGASDTASDDPYAHEAQRFEAGAEAMAYLPTSVRRSLYVRVETPTHYDGKVVRYDDGSIGVVVVRADASKALVADAELSPDAQGWKVTMYTYTASAKRVGRA